MCVTSESLAPPPPSPRKAWRGVIVGSPNSPGGDQDSPPSSSDESSGDEDTASQLSSPGQAHKASTDHSFQDLPSTMDVYGFELTEPSKDDALLYERCDHTHFLCVVCLTTPISCMLYIIILDQVLVL